MERILVVDFGGQYAHLITNRFRRMNILADIISSTDLIDEIKSSTKTNIVKGIIFSGGPSSVYEKNAPDISIDVFSMNIPILGICYGQQLIAYKLGGVVKQGKIKEYGTAQIKILHKKSNLFNGLNKSETVWMSHGDSVCGLPKDFKIIASTKNCQIAAMENENKQIYGIQFHPEVTHSVNGNKLLENFAVKICNCKREWTSDNYFNEISKNILEKAKDKKIFLLVSGGVDSVVLFTLLNKIMGKERVFGLHVDTGFMRKDESSDIMNVLHNLKLDNLKIVDASDDFFNALKNAVEPEEKRKIIGNLFIDVVNKYSKKLFSSDDWLIAQGTIYPDTIESKGTKNSDLIKTHHNRVPKMQELIKKGKVIEPLAHLYKDEVRILGKKLNLSDSIIQRHPFPGPGLAVRILCNDKKTEDSLELNRKINSKIRNTFILPIKSVGVQGDSRTYKHPAVIVKWDDWGTLEKTSTELINSFPEINRVLLLLKKKCRGIPVLLRKKLTKERTELLKDADFIVTKIMHKEKLYNNVWQMPVVLIPISFSDNTNQESIILRPVDSKEAMTANFSRLPKKAVEKIVDELLKLKNVDAVFYDITNKPPATIEWE